MLAIWSLVPLPFLNPVCTSGSSWFRYCWSLAFEHYLATMWNECSCVVVWPFFGTLFFGIGMKTDFLQSCGHCWVFQICWHIECSTLAAASFRIWNSSAGGLAPPLAVFVVMLPKAHLTSHSRMSGSRWVTTPSWLSGSLRPFLYNVSLNRSFFFFFLPYHVACRTLDPWPGIEPMPPAMEVWSPDYWTTGKLPKF